MKPEITELLNTLGLDVETDVIVLTGEDAKNASKAIESGDESFFENLIREAEEGKIEKVESLEELVENIAAEGPEPGDELDTLEFDEEGFKRFLDDLDVKHDLGLSDLRESITSADEEDPNLELDMDDLEQINVDGDVTININIDTLNLTIDQ